ncbi:TetR/AcrR family transcriptional regulator [Gordonia jacobaea]|uniref:TetR/AcrR family transcriptional regulator n=1 Tax=Gordonia jacobaea TaxID=122202 RepID=UPI003D71C41F
MVDTTTPRPEGRTAPPRPEGRTAPPRPGGRTAAVRTAVLTATEDALIDAGFAGIDLSAIAAAAGVGKTTVYRRWGTPEALVADLLGEMATQSVSATRTGNLADDLLANARLVVDTLRDRRQGPLFGALIAAATGDDRTREALAEFYRTRVREWVSCVDDAIGRGDIPDDTDTSAVIRSVSAPLYYLMLTGVRTPTEHDARMAVDATLAALDAGAFTADTVRTDTP